MELLKERIRKDGVVKEGNVLKVDRFLILFGQTSKITNYLDLTWDIKQIN